MKKEPIEYDIKDLMNAIRCAYYSKFKKSLGDKALIEFTEQTVDKPFQMPSFLRTWLLSCGESDAEVIMWLRKYV